MRQHDRLDAGRIDRQRFPVALPQVLQTLKQSTIDQDPMTVDLQQMLGSGDGPCGAEKGQRRHLFTSRNG